MEPNLWEIEFWENGNGNSPVEKVLAKLGRKDPGLHFIVMKRLAKMQKKSVDSLFKSGDVESIKNGLWELRIPAGKNEFRMLGVLNQKIVIPLYASLHAFHKKTKKIDPKEMNTALARLKEYNKTKK